MSKSQLKRINFSEYLRMLKSPKREKQLLGIIDMSVTNWIRDEYGYPDYQMRNEDFVDNSEFPE